MRFLYVCFLVMQFVPFYRGLIDGLSMVSRGFLDCISLIFPFPLSPHFPLLPHICGRVILLVSCARDFMSEFSAAVFCSRRYSAVCLLSPMQSYNIFFKNANNYSLFCTIVPKNLQMSINFRTVHLHTQLPNPKNLYGRRQKDYLLDGWREQNHPAEPETYSE